MKLNIKAAVQELLSKSESQLEYDTAVKWTERAAAGYILAVEATTLPDKIKWFVRAEDLKHEALEHAALVEDNAKALAQIEKTLDHYKLLALKDLGI